jgi:hypothetical protein
VALQTFDWSAYGKPNSFKITDICHTISHQYGGGYDATRPEGSKIQKAFEFEWVHLSTAQMLNFIEFWRSVKGNATAFYFPVPYAFYGSPGYGGYGGIEPVDGFDADDIAGYGEGPIFIAKFVDSKQPQSWRTDTINKWSIKTAIREVA